MSFEFCLVEWIWDEEDIRVTLPGGPETFYPGSYAEVAERLTALGREGWDVVGCSGQANWLLWTLRRAT